MIAIHVEFPRSRREEREQALRRLVPIVCAAIGETDVAGTLAVALADAEDALVCFQALAAQYDDLEPVSSTADDGMRSCRQCANLAASGRCLAAWRGERFGVGTGVSRRYEPALPDAPQRCGAYSPGPADAERRSGQERWAFLFAETVR